LRLRLPLTVAAGGALLCCGLLLARSSPAATCSATQHARSAKALAAYRKQMPKERAAYFRSHKSPRLRAKFVKAQQARLGALKRAAACTVKQTTTVPGATTTQPSTTTTTVASTTTVATTTTTTVVSTVTTPATTSTSTSTTTTASTTTTPTPPHGGTVRLNMSSPDVDYTDPSLANYYLSWQLEYATALKLYNYPDVPTPDGRMLVPEGATGFPLVSPDGKTYTFTVASGFEFSDGSPVTASNYAFAINRALQPAMQSGAAPLINDIVGAQAVLDGTAQTASGVHVSGNTLTIELTHPDGGLTAKLAMPFFQALPLELPTDARGVLTYPSAGPYYLASRTPGQSIVLRRNPHYGGSRPAYVDEFDITVNTNVDQSLLQVKAGGADFDLAALPLTAHGDLAVQYGVNALNGRYHVNPQNETDYLALNTSRPPFSDVTLRKALNYAIDRPALAAQRGPYAASPTDQILPPGMPGFTDVDLYPTAGPDLATAQALAAGAAPCGTVNLWSASSAIATNQAQVVKTALEHIGCSVNVKLFAGIDGFLAASIKGADFDAFLTGWTMDLADPADFIDVLLNGEHIEAVNNDNLSYFDNPAINAAIDAANATSPPDRYSQFGALDAQIMRDHAPWVPLYNRNERDFTSARLGGYVFQPALGSADLSTLYIRPG
jgi:peptide/nickel transport system substrate-binding protein